MFLRMLAICTLAMTALPLSAFAEEVPESEDDVAEQQEIDERCNVEATNGGVHCVRGDGGVSWEIHHPSLWDEFESYEAQVDERSPVGPIESGGRVFYGVRGDLIEVDPDRGVVVGRRRMVAPIRSLRLTEEGDNYLELVLEFRRAHPDLAGGEFSIVPGIDAPGPSNSPWYGAEMMYNAASTDSAWLERRLIDEESPMVFEHRVAAYERDPFNLALLAELTSEENAEDFMIAQGEQFDQIRGSDERKKALIAAVHQQWHQVLRGTTATAGAPWQDLIEVSWQLEEDSFGRGVATDVFAAGHQKMLEAGIEPKRYSSSVAAAIVSPSWAGRVVSDAIAEGDAQRVDDLSRRLYLMAPLVEDGDLAWSELATWLEDQGQSGDDWRQRAQQNAEESYSFHRSDALSATRYFSAIYVGLFYALLTFAFLIGIYGGRARRRQDRSEEGAPWWVPLLGIRHFIGLLLLLVAIVICLYPMGIHSKTGGTMMTAPTNIMGDTLAAPDVRLWLEGLAPGPARDELMEISTHEFEALQRGQRMGEKSPVIHLVWEAAAADAQAAQRDLYRGGWISNLFTADEVSPGLRSGWGSIPILRLFSNLGSLIFCLFLGTLVGSRLPRVALWIVRLIPGGAPLLAPVGGLVLGGVLATITLLPTGADRDVNELVLSMVANRFGLEEILQNEVTSPDLLGLALVLGGAILIQVAAVAVELVRARPDAS